MLSGGYLSPNGGSSEGISDVGSYQDVHQCQSDRFSFADGLLRHLLLDRDGVLEQSDGTLHLRLCNECSKALNLSRVPKYALANKLYLRDVPEVLQHLTPIEESIVSLNRAKSWIVQLQENDPAGNVAAKQTGMRGHTIVYPQDPDVVAPILPPTIQDIVTPICVIFVGHKMPSTLWLKEHAAPLIVRADRIHAALMWLKLNNPLHTNVRIDPARINALNRVDFLLFHVEHVLPSFSQDALQSRYDDPSETVNSQPNISLPPTLDNIVVANVDCNASSKELRAAAIRHIVEDKGGYLMHPHRLQPVKDFVNPELFPMLYPTLFPYGIGGVEDVSRVIPISFKAHICYLLSLCDSRFREHHSFMFTAFNIIQQRAVLLHTSLKVRKSDFSAIASRFATVSLNAVQRVSARVAKGDYITVRDDEEKHVLELMKQVNVISSHVPGSAAMRMSMRNEIRGMMIHLGLPSFYITLNPADVYNPVVKFLAGKDINVDSLPIDNVPTFREQSILVA
ncbi:hypothetical protein C0992_012882 [Termitomyces sp. T32_za158]|nr:hypothetical protein C0992_012882 [Termitomyces sp. T32_za158]